MDISAKAAGARTALETALIESRARYKALVELTCDFAWETGPDGTFVFVSPQGALGYEAAELVGRRPETFAGAPRAADEPSPFAARAPVAAATVWWRRKDGSEACLAVSAAPIEDAAGAWRGARGVGRDATGELARDDALAAALRREGLLAHILQVMRDVADPAEMLAVVAAASARALGAASCRIDAIGSDGAERTAAAFGTTDDAGRLLASPTVYRQAANGAVTFTRAADAPDWSAEDRALLPDIADRIGLALAQAAAHEALAALARTDPLTGLLNRRAFLDDLAARLVRRGAGAAPAALYFVDLDNFKAVNDAAGHEQGDAALRAVATLLVAHTRPGDLAARLGGDEFALWLERIAPDAAAERAADLVAAARPLTRFSPPGKPALGFSVGAVTWEGGADAEPAAMLARADEAMYRAKRAGKGGFAVVDGGATGTKPGSEAA